MHSLGRNLALMLLIFITILVPDSSCSIKGWDQMPRDGSFPFSDGDIFPDGGDVTVEMEISTSVSVQLGIKARLFCPPIPSKQVTLIIWEITPRGWPSCRLPYRAELQQISEKICTDRGTTWAPPHHQSSDLQIKSVALKHDGHYSCQIETTDGIFQSRHSIQVPGTTSILPSLLSILYVKLAVTLLIVGFAFFQSRNYFRSNGEPTTLAPT
ncbi:cell surface glycoprotein CD200 receptor 3-like isoform X4 [Mus pahari]|uniref:cell surface glycoprotein CD200 receptor 3-like isoform X4 n=1 Tax=Mus pahari TaxID=10093 RepID=UPI000A3091F8|nr:cell surface glycoprotein CD200 receptor 3-like isoform X4 [Mus pahari]